MASVELTRELKLNYGIINSSSPFYYLEQIVCSVLMGVM